MPTKDKVLVVAAPIVIGPFDYMPEGAPFEGIYAKEASYEDEYAVRDFFYGNTKYTPSEHLQSIMDGEEQEDVWDSE